MTRAALNLLIDAVTFIVMLAMVTTGLLLRFVLPPGSGERRSVWELTRHEWGGVHFWLATALGGLVLVHLALHWGWVCAFVSRWFRRPSAPARPSSALRRNLLGLAAVAALVATLGGFVIIAQKAVLEHEGSGRGIRGGREAPADVEGGGGRRQFRGGRGAGVDRPAAAAGPASRHGGEDDAAPE